MTIGSTLGRFRITAKLGEGAGGLVFQAFDPQLSRSVALKVSFGQMNDNSAREARTLAKLEHPNVVAVHDFGAEGETLFIAMELVRGGTLGEWLADHRSSAGYTETLLNLLSGACRGLIAVHQAGLVHRGIDPSNILVGEDGRARVGGVGLARAMRSTVSDGDTLTGQTVDEVKVTANDAGLADHHVGTTDYMSPEQLTTGVADASANQYSFCIIVWEALYGSRPHMVRDAEVEAVRGSSALPQVSRGASARLEAVLRKGLAFRSEERHVDLEPVLSALESASHSEARPRERRVWLSGITAVAAVGVVGAATDHFVKNARRCAGGERAFAETWSDTRKPSVERAVVATSPLFGAESWRRIERKLDDYAERWATSFHEACAATRLRGEQTEADLDARLSCLRGAQERVAAVVELIERQEPELLARTDELLAELPDVELCRTVTPGDGKVVGPSVRLTAKAAALRAAGRPSQALKVVEEALATRRGDTPPELDAGLLLESARILVAMGQLEKAQDQLEQAYERGVEADRPDLTTSIALEIGSVLYARSAGPGAMRTWLDVARTESVRVSADYDFELRRLEAFVQEVEGDTAEALRTLDLAIDAAAADPAELPLALLESAKMLGNDESRISVAVETARSAISAHNSYFGAGHPRLAEYESVLSANLLLAGDQTGAASAAKRAYERGKSAFGENHPSLSRHLRQMAAVACDRNRFDEGAAWAEKAVSLQRERPGVELLHSLTELEHCLRMISPVRAVEVEKEIVTQVAELKGPRHPRTANARAILAFGLWQTGDLAASKEQLETASAIADEVDAASLRDFVIMHATVAALAGGHGDARRALRHSEEAVRRLEDTERGSLKLRQLAASNLCTGLRLNGRLEEAVAACQDALSLAAQRNDLISQALLENDLGGMLEELGNVDDAVSLWIESVAHSRESAGARSTLQCNGLVNLGSSYEELGRYDESEASYREAFEILEGSEGSPLWTTSALGVVHLTARRGAYEEAEELLGVISKNAPGQNAETHARILEAQGIIEGFRGRRTRQYKLYSRAVELVRAVNNQPEVDRLCESVGRKIEICRVGDD